MVTRESSMDITDAKKRGARKNTEKGKEMKTINTKKKDEREGKT